MDGITNLRVRKLKWLCRRGMKELDVLLESFIGKHAEELEQGAWPELEPLLAMEDDRLWDIVQNPAILGTEYQALLKQISHVSAKPD